MTDKLSRFCNELRYNGNMLPELVYVQKGITFSILLRQVMLGSVAIYVSYVSILCFSPINIIFVIS